MLVDVYKCKSQLIKKYEKLDINKKQDYVALMSKPIDLYQDKNYFS